jgi:hypothetical protein
MTNAYADSTAVLSQASTDRLTDAIALSARTFRRHFSLEQVRAYVVFCSPGGKPETELLAAVGSFIQACPLLGENEKSGIKRKFEENEFSTRGIQRQGPKILRSVGLLGSLGAGDDLNRYAVPFLAASAFFFDNS